MKMFLKCFGRNRRPPTLSQRDWDRFIRERRSGKVGPSGKPVPDRTIERDLRFMLAVLNWAAKPRNEDGRLLLESNPLRGLKVPAEKNPTRVVLTGPEYEALLKVSPEMDWRFRVALFIAHETGHRLGAIRQLRWSTSICKPESSGGVRIREDRLRAPHTPDRRGDRCFGRGAEAEPRNRRHSRVARAQGPREEHEPVPGTRLMEASPPTLAGLEPKRGRGWHFPEAEVRLGPHGPAAQGALRARRLEDSPDRAAMLPTGRPGATQEGP